MRNMLKVTLVFVMLLTTVFAQAKITGDVRVRPRMDTSEDGSGELHNKIYTLYWGRLNVDADIGGGWSFHSKLATNWVGHWSGVMGENTQKGGTSGFVDRPTVSLMEISMGKNAGNWGFKAGNLPLNGVADHIVDLHYYPKSPVDIPWAIYHLQSIQGINGFVKAGPGKLNLALAVDENLNNSAVPAVAAVAAVNGWVDEDGDGKYDEWGVVTEAVDAVAATETKNTHTLLVNYSGAFGPVSVKPQMAMTMANEGTAAPTTMGAGVSAKVAGFTLSGTYLMTSNTVEGSYKYDGTHIRAGVKGTVGPGFLLAWYDMATHTPDGGVASNFSYIWALYKYTIWSGDKGALVVMPTVRIATGKHHDEVAAADAVYGWVDADEDNLTADTWDVVTEAVTAADAVAAFGDEAWGRNKLELTFQLNFK